jgi:hypothetical protein
MALLLVPALLAAGACGSDGDAPSDGASSSTSSSATASSVSAGPAAYAGYTSDVYADPDSWLCRPDLDDACDTDLDATVVEADGSTSEDPFVPAEDAPIDCFYVYPTISRDDAANSDMVPGADEEVFAVRNQAARLGSVCDVYAPVYRQGTIGSLDDRLSGEDAADTEAIAYGDVLDAWKSYIANDNDGRGVIIVGHSQGAGILARLTAEEIDPDPALRELLVSAMLIGLSQHASDFENLVPCEADTDVGCLIAYSTFRSTAPPPPDSFFARPTDDGEPAVCTNPAALSGGAADLHPYFGADGGSILGGPSDPDWGGPVATPFVTLPGFVSGECTTTDDGFTYLELTVHGDPTDPRIDDINGDLTPPWGTHLIDVNVAMGDLVALAEAEADSYLTR